MKTFVNPQGENVATENLRQLCRDYNLSYPSMIAVVSGRQVNHKGWKLPEGVEGARHPRVGRPSEVMEFVSPQGEVHLVGNLSEFCRDNALNRDMLRAVWIGVWRQYKGWTRR